MRDGRCEERVCRQVQWITIMTKTASKNVATKSKAKMTGAIILVVTLAVFGVIALQIDDWGRDWSQNFAALEPDADRPELRPVQFEVSVDEITDRVKLWAQKQPNWNWVDTELNDSAAKNEEGVQEPQLPETAATIRLTRTSAVFKFTDDVKVMLKENEDQTVTMTATSQSRVGKGDLGQNPRNLIQLVNGVKR